MENEILLALNFDLQSETVINFVERFCQLHYLDEGLFAMSRPSAGSNCKRQHFNSEVCQMARLLCTLSLSHSALL